MVTGSGPGDDDARDINATWPSDQWTKHMRVGSQTVRIELFDMEAGWHRPGVPVTAVRFRIVLYSK